MIFYDSFFTKKQEKINKRDVYSSMRPSRGFSSNPIVDRSSSFSSQEVTSCRRKWRGLEKEEEKEEDEEEEGPNTTAVYL